MPEKLDQKATTPKQAPAPAPAPVEQRPKPTKTIVAEERGSDGSYTIWWSDGSVESGQGGG